MNELDNSQERWVPVKGFEGYYEVSSHGRFKNFKGQLLSQYLHKNGYYTVSFRKNGTKKNFMSARIVGFAFPDICGEWFEGAQINHKNEIKTDNRAENLEWLTCRDNLNYGTRNKKSSETKSTKPVNQYTLEGKLVKEWKSITQINKELGFSKGNIWRALRHEKWYEHPYGFIWKYKKDPVQEN